MLPSFKKKINKSIARPNGASLVKHVDRNNLAFHCEADGMLFASHTQSYPKRSMLALGSDLVLQVTVSSAMDLLQ